MLFPYYGWGNWDSGKVTFRPKNWPPDPITLTEVFLSDSTALMGYLRSLFYLLVEFDDV